MHNQKEQALLEIQQVERGVERYFENVQTNKEKGREFDIPVGQRVVTRCIAQMVPEIVTKQKEIKKCLVEAQTTGRRLGGWEIPFVMSDPFKMAYITARLALARVGTPRVGAKASFAVPIGSMVSLELRWSTAQQAEKDRVKEAGPPNRINRLKQTIKQINPRSVKMWLKKVDDVVEKDLSKTVKIKLGAELLQILLDTCSDMITLTEFSQRRGSGWVTQRQLELTAEVKSQMSKNHKICAEDAPWFLPMVCPPRPWKEEGEAYTGGYLMSQAAPLIKKSGHTSDLVSPVSEAYLEALNHIGATPWCINIDVLRVLQEAIAQGETSVLPVAPPLDMPAEYPSDVWAKMSREERREAKLERLNVYNHNFRLENKRAALRRAVAVAEEFKQYDEIFFPHSLDFRGRAYPIPQDLHPQSDDVSRGLLTFANTKRLGKSGLLWLCYHAANAYGEDKITRDEQVDWVLSHLDDIAAVAADPLGRGLEFWSAAEEPWQFLAVAMELEEAFASGNPEEFQSSLPVYVDGSCNGLQHLSAMGLDPEGAHATNLTSDPVRQDIYQIVADKVSEAVWSDQQIDAETLVQGGEPSCAGNWYGHITRKTVKRGVMTTPYGLTDIGMRDQLIKDRWTDGLSGDPVENATYLRNLMKDALSDTVSAAMDIMGWMQDNTYIMANNGVPMEWTTPAGFKVRQAYYNPRITKVKTCMGQLYIQDADRGGPINVVKQCQSIAPNIVHSFDAAHMCLTINRAASRGVSNFAVVHDSFGVHACDMDAFLGDVKQEFVNIYKEDWFQNLQREFQALAGEAPLIAPPERGSFDIEEVNRAKFFFA